jgi:ParB/RepB/Spo0J family partition protein
MAKQSFKQLNTADYQPKHTVLADEIIKDSSREYLEVPLDRLLPNPRQPRKIFVETEIKSLAEDIKSQGLLQDILVRLAEGKEGWYEIICGDRRSRACRLLSWKTIPAQVRKATDAELLQLALAENEQRESLTPLERADAYIQLGQEIKKEQGKSEQDDIPVRILAERVHKHKDHVQQHLNLRKASLVLQQWIEKDPSVSVRIIDELRKLPDESLQKELMHDVQNKVYNQDGIIAIVREYRNLQNQGASFLPEVSIPRVDQKVLPSDFPLSPSHSNKDTPVVSPTRDELSSKLEQQSKPGRTSDPVLQAAKRRQHLQKDDEALKHMLEKYRGWQGEEKKLFSQYAEQWIQLLRLLSEQ